MNRRPLFGIWTVVVALLSGSALSPGAAEGQARNRLDARLEYLLRPAGAPAKRASTVAVTLRFADTPSRALLEHLEAAGVRFIVENGERRGTRTVFPAEAPVELLATLSQAEEIVALQPQWRPFRLPPLDVSRPGIQADSAWTLRDHLGAALTGRGILIADFDTGVDFFHPMLWFADGDTVAWLDANGNAAFDPGTDGVDKNGNGTLDGGEILRYVEISYSANTVGVYDSDLDFLYNDANGNGVRDRGAGSGFTESSPTYGEQWYVALDANGNRRLDTGELLVALKTSKIRAIREIDGTVRRRGIDLIHANPDMGAYGGHGTSVAGIAVGGVAGIHRLAGIAPDAEMIFGSIDYNPSPRFFTGLPAMMLWAESEGAAIMLYEDGEWVWEYLDGSSNEEVMINEMAHKGIVQICPAGNLTGGGMQKTVTVPANDSLTVRFTGGVSNTIWPSLRWRIAGGNITVRMQVDGSGFVTLPADSSTITIGSKEVFADTDVSLRGTTMLIMRIGVSGGSVYDLRIINAGSDSVRVDGMLGDDGVSWAGLARWSVPGEEHTVTWPATADSAIGIAAYANRVATADINTFSGRGTRIDGRSLIDVAAPGSTVYTIGLGIRYRPFGGTSSAGPHAAGAAAILLQGHGPMPHGRLRELLRNGALTDVYTGTVPNTTWGWGKVRIVDSYNQMVTSVDRQRGVASAMFLYQNYPNPFNPATTIRYSIPGGREGTAQVGVRLALYDLLGREVALLVDRRQAPGTYEVKVNATGLASGVYLYRLQTDEGSQTRRLVVLR